MVSGKLPGPVPSAGHAGGGQSATAGGCRQSSAGFFDRSARRAGAKATWWTLVQHSTRKYMLNRHRYAARLMWSHIGLGWHRSTNIVFDCGSNLRRAAWGASVQACAADDPAASWTVLNVDYWRAAAPLSPGVNCSTDDQGLKASRTPCLLRTHEPACPAAHLVCSMWPRDFSDARCSWTRRKNSLPMLIRY